jgi:hypothetical protein
MLAISFSVSAEIKENRNYLAINGEVFNGHFTKEDGLKAYDRYSTSRDKILNKLAKRFPVGSEYSGIYNNGKVKSFSLKKIELMPWYECMPECGPVLKFGDEITTPIFLWTGKIELTHTASKQCQTNKNIDDKIYQHISTVVDNYFGENGLVKGKDAFGFEIKGNNCNSFKINEKEVKQVDIEISVTFDDHKDFESRKHIKFEKPVFNFRVVNNIVKADSRYLSTECCGFHTGGGYIIDSILNLSGHDIVLYKWTGLESSSYTVMPFDDFFKGLDERAISL